MQVSPGRKPFGYWGGGGGGGGTSYSGLYRVPFFLALLIKKGSDFAS